MKHLWTQPAITYTTAMSEFEGFAHITQYLQVKQMRLLAAAA
jgi:hypothetical protein